jgi:hypothetical protein
LFAITHTVPGREAAYGGVPRADDIAGAGLLDLDHLGAHVGKDLGRVRAGERGLQRKHAHAVESAARF